MEACERQLLDAGGGHLFRFFWLLTRTLLPKKVALAPKVRPGIMRTLLGGMGVHLNSVKLLGWWSGPHVGKVKLLGSKGCHWAPGHKVKLLGGWSGHELNF